LDSALSASIASSLSGERRKEKGKKRQEPLRCCCFVHYLIRLFSFEEKRKKETEKEGEKTAPCVRPSPLKGEEKEEGTSVKEKKKEALQRHGSSKLNSLSAIPGEKKGGERTQEEKGKTLTGFDHTRGGRQSSRTPLRVSSSVPTTKRKKGRLGRKKRGEKSVAVESLPSSSHPPDRGREGGEKEGKGRKNAGPGRDQIEEGRGEEPEEKGKERSGVGPQANVIAQKKKKKEKKEKEA